jgi:DNA-binding CsgD family transcriptional regulator
VRRLIEAVPDEHLDAAGALLLGEAMYELGAFDAAERVLELGQQRPGSEQVALRLAVTRAKNAQWGLCQPEAALAINAAARAVITSPPLAEQLVADEASVLTFSGHPDRALAVLERIEGASRRTRVVRAIAAAPALALTGQTAEALKVAEAGYADHLALGDELAIAHPAMHLVNQVFALAEANRFAGPRRLVLSGLALACAMLGDADAAAQALAERDTGPAFGFRQPEQQLADAWTALAAQRPAEAAERFRDAAAQAASTGHRTAEAWLLHDLMRTTGTDTSARLRELASTCDSPLVSARARHATAARARNAAELASAASDFEALGAMLLAAEAAADAAEAFSRAGDQRAAANARRRSSALAAACEGAATPGLIHTAGPVPLSRREREIVMLAVTGMASKDIAQRLYLSVRTVNNHLQHAYTKLGVTSRDGLTQALGSTS